MRTCGPQRGEFGGDLTSPRALSEAANRLTADDPAKLTSLAAIIAQLEQEAQAAKDTGKAASLLTLAAAMRADGLGMAHVHFRVNAKQLHNAIRTHLHENPELDLASKGAMATLRKMLEEVSPKRTNFASLAIESSTATRQFLAMAQILGHIDADTPIRMLIAECEQPSTILAALYFARLFEIEDKVDVSPCSKPKARWNTEAASLRRCVRRRSIAITRGCAGGCASRPAFPMQGALSGRSPPASRLSGFRVGSHRRWSGTGSTMSPR